MICDNKNGIRTIAPPPVRVGIWVKKKIAPRSGLGFGLELVLGLGGNVPLGQLS